MQIAFIIVIKDAVSLSQIKPSLHEGNRTGNVGVFEAEDLRESTKSEGGVVQHEIVDQPKRQLKSKICSARPITILLLVGTWRTRLRFKKHSRL